MKVFCCQLDIAWENKAANFTKVRKLIAAANVPASSLVLLPEMFATGFSMGVPAIAETGAEHRPKDSPTIEFLAQTAREFGIYLIGGLVTGTVDGRGRNQSAVFAPDGKEIARYSKCQPFSLGGESQHYEAGKEIVTFQWHDCVVAPFICYDLRFPELFRAAVRREAQLFAVIANWPVKRIQHWITLLQARAIENQAYVVGVNRTGTDPKFFYNGHSLIVNPHGEILADASAGEGVIGGEVDLPALKAWRAEFPALQDMRVGAAWRKGDF
jgi:predicted amidohydrolase